MPPPPARAADTPQRQVAQAFSCVRVPTATGPARLLLVGELDRVAADRTRAALRRVQDETRELNCDLSDVSFIDLCGLQVLLDAAVYAKRIGGRLTVSNCPPIVSRILRLLGLEDALEIQPAPRSAPSHPCAAIRRHVSRRASPGRCPAD